MTDTAPDPNDPAPDGPSFLDELGKMALQLGGSLTTYKQAQLESKTKLDMAKLELAQAKVAAATSMPDDGGGGTAAFAKWAPWIAGGLLVVAVFMAVRK